MSFNKITVVGNLGRDPELRYTPQGTPVCSFTVASNERRKDKNGEAQDITTWFRGTLFGQRAETFAQYLTKGKPVYVEGRLRQEVWTDRDGKERTTLEINVTDFNFIGNGNGNASVPTGAARQAAEALPGPSPEQPNDDDDDDDGIPF